MTLREVDRPEAASSVLAARWHETIAAASFQGRGASFWNSWVLSLPEKRVHSGYVEEVLCRLDCRHEDAVLDVGAGTGALSLPLAGRACRVTALDQSEAMLKRLADNATAAGITNINTLLMDWTTAKLGVDFEPHDVVLVSRSLPAGKDILRCLELINHSARRACYVTWKMDGHDPLEEELCRLLGAGYHPFPGASVLCDIIRSLNYEPSVDTFTTHGRRVYESLEQAYTHIVRSFEAAGEARQRVLDFLASRLEYRGGCYAQPKDTTWALIHWEKG